MAQRSRHSHRGSTSRYFEKGEKVLCYEPDPTKAKVLYDSKILGTYETKDKRGRKVTQYKVHFQGWSSSWDRKVNADFVLKDTTENRLLQRNLAEKAQLQLGAYLYRKDRGSSKKKQRKLDDATDVSGNSIADLFTTPHTLRMRVSSEDNFSSSSTIERQEDFLMKDDFESESCCSSVESIPDEERVLLRISERLRQFLEYDHDMIVKYGKHHVLPARIPVVTILENFVKHNVLKSVFSTAQVESTRRRSTQQRTDKKEREFDKLVATARLLKEVADGLRIYFDFTFSDYLLYKEEKVFALAHLSEENLKNFTYVAAPDIPSDFLHPKSDTEQASTSGGTHHASDASGTDAHPTDTPTHPSGEPVKRKLRLHRSEDCDLILENCLSSIASTSSGASTPLHAGGGGGFNCLRSLQPMALNIPSQTRDFLQSVLSWHLLPSNAAPLPSMIFGAPHLARLIVKLPDFLNATAINDEKLKTLLNHLDTFVNFLEARKDWFNEDNYVRSPTTRKRARSGENAKLKSIETLQEHLDANNPGLDSSLTMAM